MATKACVPYHETEESKQLQVQQKANAAVPVQENQVRPIINPVVGMVLFLGIVVASNVVLDVLNYLINHILGR